MSAGSSEEPNLTPFIDLFSVLVCFLLMTAAWLQLEALQINIDPSNPDAPAQSQEPPPPPPLNQVKLSVKLYADKVVLSENQAEKSFPNSNNQIDRARVSQALLDWRTKFTEQKDIVLNSEKDVKYGSLISMYDILISSKWPDVAINPN